MCIAASTKGCTGLNKISEPSLSFGLSISAAKLVCVTPAIFFKSFKSEDNIWSVRCKTSDKAVSYFIGSFKKLRTAATKALHMLVLVFLYGIVSRYACISLLVSVHATTSYGVSKALAPARMDCSNSVSCDLSVFALELICLIMALVTANIPATFLCKSVPTEALKLPSAIALTVTACTNSCNITSYDVPTLSVTSAPLTYISVPTSPLGVYTLTPLTLGLLKPDGNPVSP